MSLLPPPIPFHTISLLLQYLSPLDNPIPSHLLSTPLRQRHHFLALDPQDDPLQYLTWPSNNSHSSKLYSLLAGLPSPEDIDPLTAHSTRYTFDGDTYFAHVHIDSPTYSLSYSHYDDQSTDGPRFIFRWEPDQVPDGSLDDGAGWKYHDLQTMPFPSDAPISPSGVDPTNTAAEHEPTGTNAHSLSHVPTTGARFVTQPSESDDDDDDYWNSYGGGGYSDNEDAVDYRDRAGSRRSRRSVATDDEKAEDAYWARYSSVQGTADSTIPTPPPQGRRRLQDPAESLGLPDFTFNSGQVSPDDLAYRLETISPRPPPSPSPAVHLEVETNGILVDNASDIVSPSDTSGTSATHESATITPPQEPLFVPKLESPRPRKPIDAPFLMQHAEEIDTHDFNGSKTDEALWSAIRGVYALWSASRSHSKDRHSDVAGSDTFMSDKDAFLDTVKRAVESL